jgi:hypothetical protein
MHHTLYRSRCKYSARDDWECFRRKKRNAGSYLNSDGLCCLLAVSPLPTCTAVHLNDGGAHQRASSVVPLARWGRSRTSGDCECQTGLADPKTILQLFDSSTSDPTRAKQLQSDLHQIQSTPEAWGLVEGLSEHPVIRDLTLLTSGRKCPVLLSPHGSGQDI